MVKCSAPNCCNATYNSNPQISFHRFPKDEYTKKAWLNNMKRPNWQPSSCSMLCSEHFERNIIDKDGFRPVLLHGAVPTIFDLHKQQPSKEIKRSIDGKPVLQEIINEAPLISKTPCSVVQPSTSYLPDLPVQPTKQNVFMELGPSLPSTSREYVEHEQASKLAENIIADLKIQLNKAQEEKNKLKNKAVSQSKKIKLLKQRNRRLHSKISKISDVINHLREKEKKQITADV